MTARTRRIAAALTGILALGTGTAAWAASAAAAAPAAAPRCSAGTLGVWVNADSANGAAGTIYYNLDLTNTGRHTCTLDGYPGVSATTSGGKQIGAAARRNAATPARVVTLAPGETAHSVFGYLDVPVGSCQMSKSARLASFLKVYPPDDTGTRHAFFAEPVCTTKTIDLVIERVAPGA